MELCFLVRCARVCLFHCNSCRYCSCSMIANNNASGTLLLSLSLFHLLTHKHIFPCLVRFVYLGNKKNEILNAVSANLLCFFFYCCCVLVILSVQTNKKVLYRIFVVVVVAASVRLPFYFLSIYTRSFSHFSFHMPSIF